MNKKYLFIIAVFFLAAYGFYMIYTMYNKPHKIIAEQAVDFSMTVDEMIEEFNTDETGAGTKFIDKVVILEGVLKSISSTERSLSIMMLEGKSGMVNCEFSDADLQLAGSPNPGDKISVKGLFIGYDDLLGELQLKKCTIMPSNSQK